METNDDAEVASINELYIKQESIRYNKRPIPHCDTIITKDSKKRRKIDQNKNVEVKQSVFYTVFCCCR